MHPAIGADLASAQITDVRQEARRAARACTARHRAEPVPARLTADGARCQPLFASGLQRSDAPGPGRAAEAIRAAGARFGAGGCALRMAQEFGDHPEAAAERMRWVRSLLGLTPPVPSRRPRSAGHKGRHHAITAPQRQPGMGPHTPIPRPASLFA
jgi:hypothetical protein